MTNLFVDDAMIYASGDSVGAVKLKMPNAWACLLILIFFGISMCTTALSKYILPVVFIKTITKYIPQGPSSTCYRSYIKARLNYGITLYGCSTQTNNDLVQRVQNHTSMLTTGNFDLTNCRGMDLVKSLILYTVHDMIYYFLTILIFTAA